MDLQRDAHTLYPSAQNETKNRQVITSALANINFAAKNEMCSYIKVRKFQENVPQTRKAWIEDIHALIDATDSYEQLLIKALRFQGWRITETLRGMHWSQIDMAKMTVDFWINKAPAWKAIHLHPDVYEALSRVALAERNDPVLPWRDR